MCNPQMGNLAVGRHLHTDTQCSSSSSLDYSCSYEDVGSCVSRCEPCDPKTHPSSAMTDSPFTRPPTWWQSATDTITETLQLDLEVEFYFTHLIMIFHSPRPAVMTVERSQDFGHTWSTLRLYAHNCSVQFGLVEDLDCTERYSSAQPCNGGEVSCKSKQSEILYLAN